MARCFAQVAYQLHTSRDERRELCLADVGRQRLGADRFCLCQELPEVVHVSLPVGNELQVVPAQVDVLQRPEAHPGGAERQQPEEDKREPELGSHRDPGPRQDLAEPALQPAVRAGHQVAIQERQNRR